MRFKKVFLFSAVLILGINFFCFAEDESIAELKATIKKLEARIKALENKFEEQDSYIEKQQAYIETQRKKIVEYDSKLEDIDARFSHREKVPTEFIWEGLKIGAAATFIVQGTQDTNAAAGGNSDTADASYSVDLEFEKEFGEVGGRAFLHLGSGEGAGIEDELELYSNVNNDADNDNNFRVKEVWYEQGLFNDRMLVTFGKLDPTVYFDTNEVANNEKTQFLAGMFCNSPTLELPDNSAGIRVAVIPRQWVEFEYGVLNANSEWEDIGENMFNIGQITLKPDFFNRNGNYRILAWYNNADHTRWLNTTKTKEGNYGFGLSFDQEVTDTVTLFTRYGWQDPEVYNPNTVTSDNANFSLEHAWSAGFQVKGEPWGRQNDVFGFAVGQAIASDDYKKSNSALKAKNEGHLEAYYNIYINKHFSISPDIQFIWNPFGDDAASGDDTILVGGVRSHVDF